VAIVIAWFLDEQGRPDSLTTLAAPAMAQKSHGRIDSFWRI